MIVAGISCLYGAYGMQIVKFMASIAQYLCYKKTKTQMIQSVSVHSDWLYPVPRLVPLPFLACLRSAVVLRQTRCFTVFGCCAVVVVMVVVVNDRSHAVMSLLLAMIPAMAVTVWSA